MTKDLARSEWKSFLDGISRDLNGWETTIQIMNSETGVQVLSGGLPFNGATYEENGKGDLELLIGSDPEYHQTHNIVGPVRVAFEPRNDGPAGTLDIEDASGTKTLITFRRPMQVLAKNAASEMTVT